MNTPLNGPVVLKIRVDADEVWFHRKPDVAPGVYVDVHFSSETVKRHNLAGYGFSLSLQEIAVLLSSMKVFAVQYSDDENQGVVGVFSSAERAVEAVNAIADKKYPYALSRESLIIDELVIDEPASWTAPYRDAPSTRAAEELPPITREQQDFLDEKFPDVPRKTDR